MADPNSDFLGEPIPLDFGEDTSSLGKPPAKKDELFPASPNEHASSEPPSKIRTFEVGGTTAKAATFKRPVNITGHGATRCRTFHSRLSDSAMQYMDQQINEWLDQNTDIEVKFCSTTVGIVEGKRQDPHLIVTVWY